MYNYVIDEQRYFCLFSSNSAGFYSFFFLTAPPRTSSTVLNASGGDTSCLVPDLRGSTPPPVLECDVNCGFSVDAVYQVEVVGFFPGVFSISVDMLVFC